MKKNLVDCYDVCSVVSVSVEVFQCKWIRSENHDCRGRSRNSYVVGVPDEVCMVQYIFDSGNRPTILARRLKK